MAEAPAAFVDRARRNLIDFDRKAAAGRPLRPAAVAVVLTWGADESPCFLLTRRADRLRKHGGQWALPGGRIDAGETPNAAALRELEEELRVSIEPSEILGQLDDYPTRSGFVITPVVVWGGRGVELRPNPAEVAEAHEVPLADLGKPGVPHLRTIPESDRPVISFPLVETHVHAPTAAILYQLHEVAVLGRQTRVAHFEQPVFAWR